VKTADALRKLQQEVQTAARDFETSVSTAARDVESGVRAVESDLNAQGRAGAPPRDAAAAPATWRRAKPRVESAPAAAPPRQATLPGFDRG
jgi:hypothetical protein